MKTLSEKRMVRQYLLCLFGLILLQPLTVFAQSKTASRNANSIIACYQSSEAESAESITEVINLPTYKYVFSDNITSFVKKLNELGKCGYRLDKLTKFPLESGKKFAASKLAGIVKLDTQNKYEYDWFEAFTPGELTTRLNYRAKKGFRLRDSVDSVEEACGRPENLITLPADDVEKAINTISETLNITFGKLFILERKNEIIVELGDSRIVIGRWGWGKSPTKELQQSLEKTVKSGFVPIDMGYGKVGNRYAVFLVMTKDDSVSEYPIGNNLTYRILKSEYKFEKKVNFLAKQGFKILFYDTYGAYGFVTMFKENQSSELVSYHWVDVIEKSWQDQISELSSQGAVYKTLGSTATSLYCETFEGKLLFEKPLKDNGKRNEYKILKISDRTSHAGNKQISKDLTPTSETLQEFDDLVKEGYVISDLFYAEGINVLFERGK